MKSLEQRAMAAYFRSWNGDGALNQPSVPQIHEHKGLRYVVLSNVSGTLAVYRVRTVNGGAMLKGLKRWPAELDG